MRSPATIFQWRGAHGRPSHAAAILFGVLFVISLFVVSIWRHQESIQGAGRRVLFIDVALLLLYAVIGLCAALQRRGTFEMALAVGVPFGYVLGSIHIAHHLVEFLFPFTGPIASFALGAGHVLLALALFAVVGTAAWQRTRSVRLAVAAGIWSAILSVLILVAFAFALQLAFESRAELPLQQPFHASGLNDVGAFLVKNSLEAASEMLVGFPMLAFLMALAGALSSAWINYRTRNYALVAACLAPLMFAAGVLSLWYANSLERSLRPPFVMLGLLSAGISLAAMPATWSALRRSTPPVRGPSPSL